MALIQCDFTSESLALCCSMNVILPQPTAQQPRTGDGRLKTLWLLHGMSDDHTIWCRRTSLERYVAPLGLAVVMPAVHRSMYVDMAQGGKYGTFVGEELPRIARSFFPLSDRREDNFVAGLSMGGYGAFRLAFDHPERYAAAASLSGALDIAGRVGQVDVTRATEWTRIFGPLDQLAGGPHDLFKLAADHAAAPGDKLRLFQWCGTDDFLYQRNLAFRDHAQQLGLDLTWSEGPGGHSWDMWDAQIQNVLKWLNIGPVGR